MKVQHPESSEHGENFSPPSLAVFCHTLETQLGLLPLSNSWIPQTLCNPSCSRLWNLFWLTHWVMDFCLCCWIFLRVCVRIDDAVEPIASSLNVWKRSDLHCWGTPWEHSCFSSCFSLAVRRLLPLNSWKTQMYKSLIFCERCCCFSELLVFLWFLSAMETKRENMQHLLCSTFVIILSPTISLVSWKSFQNSSQSINIDFAFLSHLDLTTNRWVKQNSWIKTSLPPVVLHKRQIRKQCFKAIRLP